MSIAPAHSGQNARAARISSTAAMMMAAAGSICLQAKHDRVLPGRDADEDGHEDEVGDPPNVDHGQQDRQAESTAVRVRLTMALAGYCLGDASIATIALGKGLQRAPILFLVEVRPVGRRAVQLRVGPLPDQEIADPQFAGGADDEIGIRDARLCTGTG